MTMHHFSVLVPSTNAAVEIEYSRVLPPTLQVHIARIPLLSTGVETTPRSGDADVDYQSRLLGDAKVEVVALAQTTASLSADDYDERVTRRINQAAGVPAITSARAMAWRCAPWARGGLPWWCPSRSPRSNGWNVTTPSNMGCRS